MEREQFLAGDHVEQPVVAPGERRRSSPAAHHSRILRLGPREPVRSVTLSPVWMKPTVGCFTSNHWRTWPVPQTATSRRTCSAREVTSARNSGWFTASARAPRGRARHARPPRCPGQRTRRVAIGAGTLRQRCPARPGTPRRTHAQPRRALVRQHHRKSASSESGLAVIVISSCGAYHRRCGRPISYTRGRTVSTTEAPRWSWRGLSVTSRSPRVSATAK